MKTAGGGKSLNTDFRTPSAGPYEFNQRQLEALSSLRRWSISRHSASTAYSAAWWASRSASLIYVGPLANIAQAYQALDKAIKDKGLTAGDERREFYLHWEGQDSANNVYMLQATLKE